MCKKKKKLKFTLKNEVICVNANIVSGWFLVLGVAGLETAWNYGFFEKKKKKEDKGKCNDSVLFYQVNFAVIILSA